MKKFHQPFSVFARRLNRKRPFILANVICQLLAGEYRTVTVSGGVYHRSFVIFNESGFSATGFEAGGATS